MYREQGVHDTCVLMLSSCVSQYVHTAHQLDDCILDILSVVHVVSCVAIVVAITINIMYVYLMLLYYISII